MNYFNKAALALLCAAGFATSVAPAFAESGQVNIYSYRQPELIAPLLDAFTAQTGIETQVLNLSDGILERMQAEGVNSPADVILTVDIGRLTGVKEGGVTQPVNSDVIDGNIPTQYRDGDGHWFGLTTRARVVYASRERVEADNIDYADLADPEWEGRVCTRSGQHVYSIGLFASIVANEGEEAAEAWLAGLKNNLARAPAGNDRAQAQAIFSGECDIALGNTYYIGLMRTNEESPEQKEWEASIKVLFPNADGRGTHVNLSGMAMAKNAPNPENALALMEYLSSGEAQEIYAEEVFEYPVKPGTNPSELVKSFGAINADTLPLEQIGDNRAIASQLVDKVGFDN